MMLKGCVLQPFLSQYAKPGRELDNHLMTMT